MFQNWRGNYYIKIFSFTCLNFPLRNKNEIQRLMFLNNMFHIKKIKGHKTLAILLMKQILISNYYILYKTNTYQINIPYNIIYHVYSFKIIKLVIFNYIQHTVVNSKLLGRIQLHLFI
jgi:hypothetical protein